MLFKTPELTRATHTKLADLDRLRSQLGHEVERSGPWLGRLRREVRASTVEGSTTIEGFSVPHADAVALVSGETQPDSGEANRMAVACYAQAMDHVGVMADDPAFRWLDRVILDLHFDACYFQRDRNPGRWRTGPIAVTAGGGGLAYVGPDHERVVPLMTEVVDWLGGGDRDAHVVVRAAMAHLHVVSVHPFSDGNGRIARIVQSLVLAREGLLSPEFVSIEEYLADHTAAYYAALADAQGGSYQPRRDAGGWVNFCVDAHLAQARRRLEQLHQAAARWQFLEQKVESRGWPDRLVIALEQSLVGGSDRLSYGREADVSAATASADFRRLLDAGLVEQRGRGRNIRYHASAQLREDVVQAVDKARTG
jgi:Fic family protein